MIRRRASLSALLIAGASAWGTHAMAAAAPDFVAMLVPVFEANGCVLDRRQLEAEMVKRGATAETMRTFQTRMAQAGFFVFEGSAVRLTGMGKCR